MKKTILKTAIAATLFASIPTANAAVNSFTFDGIFTMLDSNGGGMANTSTTAKGANQFHTPILGTMQFDTVTGAGTGTVVPFDFFANDATAPAEAVGIKMQSIGDGAGGPGTLVLGNMLFNWNGSNGIPVSIVLDAAGFFGATGADWADGSLTQAEVAATGAVPASDGTYTLASGYLSIGAAPMATTEFNTTNVAGCTYGGCMGVDNSGQLPLVADLTPNANEFSFGDGFGVGGMPMQDGAFIGSNANFDVTTLNMILSDPTKTIAQGCTFVAGEPCSTVTAVPGPAAVWLFGSGLLGLVGVARRKNSEV